MLWNRKGFDIVSASEMNYNKTVSMQQEAYLACNIYIFSIKQLGDCRNLFCKIPVIFSILNFVTEYLFHE
jgi:hypothetical protein